MGWARLVKTPSCVTDLLSGMVMGGSPSPSPPCQGFKRKLLLLLAKQNARQPWQGSATLGKHGAILAGNYSFAIWGYSYQPANPAKALGNCQRC